MHIDAKAAELSRYTWSAPAVVQGHRSDELSRFEGQRGTAVRSFPEPPPPIVAEPLAVPSGDCRWFDDDQNVGPARQVISQSNPEDPIRIRGPGFRSVSGKHGELLPQGQVFEGKVTTGIEQVSKGAEHKANQGDHRAPIPRQAPVSKRPQIR
jgi:hypothetical protein